jgi:hypothetical protein
MVSEPMIRMTARLCASRLEAQAIDPVRSNPAAMYAANQATSMADSFRATVGYSTMTHLRPVE